MVGAVESDVVVILVLCLQEEAAVPLNVIEAKGTMPFGTLFLSNPSPPGLFHGVLYVLLFQFTQLGFQSSGAIDFDNCALIASFIRGDN